MRYGIALEHYLKPDREFWRAMVIEEDGIKTVDLYESDRKKNLKSMVLSSKWKLTNANWKRAEKYMVERN